MQPSSNWSKFKSQIVPSNSTKKRDKFVRKVTQKANAHSEPKYFDFLSQFLSEIQFNVRAPIANSYERETPIVAIDCEMVKCADKYQSMVQQLARLSIVNYNGHVLLDEYFRPKMKIMSYLTQVSGITPSHLQNAAVYDDKKQMEIINLLRNKVVVGHSLQNDFKALMIDESKHGIQKRDVSTVSFLRNDGRPQALRKLCQSQLGQTIQEGQHCSIVDARAALFIYRKLKAEIDAEVKYNNYAHAHKSLLNDLDSHKQQRVQ